MSQFKYPQIYNFPPFFTEQPNKVTFEAQLRNWSQLILNYCAKSRIWVITNKGGIVGGTGDDSSASSDSSASNFPLFENSTINRHLKIEFINKIFHHMVENGMACWYNQDILNNYREKSNRKEAIAVYWKTPSEWAQLILEFVESSGNSGSVLTLYELQYGDLVSGQEFKNIHSFILYQSLQKLVKDNRAQFMKDENGAVMGVKVV